MGRRAGFEYNVIGNGGAMKSYDGRSTLWMQSDGNLVLYGPGCTGPGSSCWASNTSWAGPTTYAVMQGDGNLVLYRWNGSAWAAVCSTGTWMYPGSVAMLQNDAQLVVYAPGMKAVWSSKVNRCA